MQKESRTTNSPTQQKGSRRCLFCASCFDGNVDALSTSYDMKIVCFKSQGRLLPVDGRIRVTDFVKHRLERRNHVKAELEYNK